jgi:putative ABC transport system permease protein
LSRIAILSTIRINGVAHTVVGIMPRSFNDPDGSNLWVLSSKPVPPPSIDVPGDLLANRDVHYSLAVARLKPDVSIAQADADLSTITKRLAQQFPKSHARRGVALQRLHEQVVGDVQRTILLLLAAVGAVLLIACANIASLLLARVGPRAGVRRPRCAGRQPRPADATGDCGRPGRQSAYTTRNSHFSQE